MVRRYEDLTPLEKLCLIDMSYSRFNTYDTCPAKYFYTYVTKEERVFGAAATLGNIVHGVLEHNIETLVLPEMVADFEALRLELDPDSLIDDELIDVGYTLMREFCDRHTGDEIDLIGVEVPFEIVIGTALIRGYIDRLERLRDGSVQVVDYKTGKSRYEVAAKDAPQDLQLGIYALAVSQMYPHTVIRAELYYLRSGRHKGHTFSPGDLKDVEKRVAEKVQAIIDDQNFSATSEIRPCTYCDYAASGVCKTGVARRRRRVN